MAKDLSKSSFIFDLIDEFEILSKSGQSGILTDEAYNAFCEKYLLLSAQRDVALLKHLKGNPNCFRTHIPYSRFVFSVVFDVVWYYDELIINDPIIGLLDNTRGDIEHRKHSLQQMLIFLTKCRESIEGGYLLFAGSNALPYNPDAYTKISRELVDVPNVQNAFDQYTWIGHKPMPINNDKKDNLKQLHILYNGLSGEQASMGVYMPPHVTENPNKLMGGITYSFVGEFHRLSKDELYQLGKKDMLDGMKVHYAGDAAIVLDALTNSQNINVPALFYRNVDSVVAQNFISLNSIETTNAIANTFLYDCTLPFTQGVPPERLFEVRNQIPNAFIEFRAFLYEIVTKAMKATNDPAELKLIIESKIHRKISSLEVEMSNANKNFMFKGVAASLTLLFGALGIYSIGFDFSTLIGEAVGSGAVVNGLKAAADISTKRNNAKLNPAYFLWKARQPS